MLDIVPVISELRTKFPHHFATLTEVPATFSRFRTQRCVTSLQIQNLLSLICNHIFQNISCNFGIMMQYRNLHIIMSPNGHCIITNKFG